MITYQVEVRVPDALVEQWCTYMTSTHIHDVVKTGHFVSAKLTRVVDPHEAGFATYRVVYTLLSHEALEIYRRDCAPALQADHTRLFGDSVWATRSVIEEVWSSSLI